MRAGTASDVTTLLHEAGHGFHEFAARDHALFWQRRPSIEAGELASMSMELLALPQLAGAGAFYTPVEAARARVAQLEEILYKLVHIASVDAFQHWLYTSPNGTDARARDEVWLSLRRRYEPEVDWNGLQPERTVRWYRQLHIFTHPLYYIEYGIAQLGALQLWAASKVDSQDALARYKRALALGGSAPLPEIFNAAGAQLIFEADALQVLVARVEEAIAEVASQSM